MMVVHIEGDSQKIYKNQRILKYPSNVKGPTFENMVFFCYRENMVLNSLLKMRNIFLKKKKKEKKDEKH